MCKLLQRETQKSGRKIILHMILYTPLIIVSKNVILTTEYQPSLEQSHRHNNQIIM